MVLSAFSRSDIRTPSAIMDSAIEQKELCERNDAKDAQQYGRQCRGIAGIPEAESDLIDVEQQQGRRIIRSPAGRRDNLVDDAERIDQGIDRNEQRCWHHQRPGDAAEYLPPARVFHACRLVKIWRDLLQSGEKENHE